MKRVVAVVCFTFAVAFSAVAQDKATSSKSTRPSAGTDAEMSAKGPDRAKKEPSAKQQEREKKRACRAQAKEQKLKGDESKRYIKECMAK